MLFFVGKRSIVEEKRQCFEKNIKKYFFVLTMEKYYAILYFKWRERMITDELEEKRQLLNELILKKADYEQILKISIELDELIEKYYNLRK